MYVPNSKFHNKLNSSKALVLLIIIVQPILFLNRTCTHVGLWDSTLSQHEVERPQLIIDHHMISTLKRDMQQRLEAVIRMPTVLSKCCTVLISDFHGRNDSTVFRLLGGVGNLIVVDTHFMDDSAHEKSIDFSFDNSAPPVVLPKRVDKV